MKFENTRVYNFQGAFRGMRNPMNSWDKSDSYFGLINYDHGGLEDFEVADKWVEKFHPQYKNYPQNWDNEAYRLSEMYDCKLIENGIIESNDEEMGVVAFIGPNDMQLAQKLIKAGPEHRKFLRQIFVSVDITAPLYWWKQADTYKISTTANSTSTMHKIMSKEFSPEMFEISNLRGYKQEIEQRMVLDENNEIWKQYPYGELYLISNYGRVKRKSYTTSNNHTLPEIILKWQYSADGYAYVGVKTDKTDGKKKNRKVHILVAETFINNSDPLKTQINHKDGNKLNNFVENLEWVTPKENSQHRASNQLQPKGMQTYKGKLTKEQREEILFRLSTEDISNRQIAKEYGVSHTTINSLVNKKHNYGENFRNEYQDFLKIIDKLNELRDEYLETKDKQVWYSLITMLPESWLQKRTWTANYQTIRAICHQRRNHKLNEWSGQDNSSKENFIAWARTLPYAQYLIFDDENIPFQIEK